MMIAIMFNLCMLFFLKCLGFTLISNGQAKDGIEMRQNPENSS